MHDERFALAKPNCISWCTNAQRFFPTLVWFYAFCSLFTPAPQEYQAPFLGSETGAGDEIPRNLGIVVYDSTRI